MTDFLTPGSSAAEVKVLQAGLNFLLNSHLAVDGHYGRRTAEWVRRFQAKEGLSTTGYCDLSTWSALAGRLNPTERHLHVLLHSAQLQVREGERILWTYPLRRPLRVIRPGVWRLEALPRLKKEGGLLRLSNGLAISREENKKRHRLTWHLAAGAPWESLLGLLKPRMPVIVDPFRRLPQQVFFPAGVTPDEIISSLGISRHRLQRTAQVTEQGTVVPVSRPTWPVFWAWPSEGPDCWLPWLPWLNGLILAPALLSAWLPAARKAALHSVLLTAGKGRRLPPNMQGWCYAPADQEELRGLRPYPPSQGRLKGLVQLLVLPAAAAAGLIPSAGLNLDWYVVPMESDLPRELHAVQHHVHPEKVLLLTRSDQVTAARLAKRRGLGGLVLTSPPGDHAWLQVWL